MIDCTTRAKLSVPPPGLDVTTNSTGFVGFQSACAVPPKVIATAVATNHDVFLIIFLPPFRYVQPLASVWELDV
jgi:hypothetical protein